MQRNKILAGIGVLALAGSTQADWQPIELNQFSHGQVVDGAAAGPVTLQAENFHHADSRLVAFDTRQRGTRDPDIEGPNGEDGFWTAGNLGPGEPMGTALVIQSLGNDFAGYTDASESVVAWPDDEERASDGARPGAGEITLKLDRQVSAFRFTVIDVEQTDAFNNRSASYVVYYCGERQVKVAFAELIDPDSAFYDPDISFDDHSANRFPEVTAEQLGLPWIDQVVINLGGSGAVGGLSFLDDTSPNIGFAQSLAWTAGFDGLGLNGAWFADDGGGSYEYGTPGGPGGSPNPPSPNPPPHDPDDPIEPPAVPTPGAGIAGGLLISLLVARRPRKHAAQSNVR